MDWTFQNSDLAYQSGTEDLLGLSDAPYFQHQEPLVLPAGNDTMPEPQFHQSIEQEMPFYTLDSLEDVSGRTSNPQLDTASNYYRPPVFPSGGFHDPLTYINPGILNDTGGLEQDLSRPEDSEAPSNSLETSIPEFYNHGNMSNLLGVPCISDHYHQPFAQHDPMPSSLPSVFLDPSVLTCVSNCPGNIAQTPQNLDPYGNDTSYPQLPPALPHRNEHIVSGHSQFQTIGFGLSPQTKVQSTVVDRKNIMDLDRSS